MRRKYKGGGLFSNRRMSKYNENIKRIGNQIERIDNQIEKSKLILPFVREEVDKKYFDDQIIQLKEKKGQLEEKKGQLEEKMRPLKEKKEQLEDKVYGIDDLSLLDDLSLSDYLSLSDDLSLSDKLYSRGKRAIIRAYTRGRRPVKAAQDAYKSRFERRRNQKELRKGLLNHFEDMGSATTVLALQPEREIHKGEMEKNKLKIKAEEEEIEDDEESKQPLPDKVIIDTGEWMG
jgi:hypothetical protein